MNDSYLDAMLKQEEETAGGSAAAADLSTAGVDSNAASPDDPFKQARAINKRALRAIIGSDKAEPDLALVDRVKQTYVFLSESKTLSNCRVQHKKWYNHPDGPREACLARYALRTQVKLICNQGGQKESAEKCRVFGILHHEFTYWLWSMRAEIIVANN